ncbi:hypothetical protein ACFFWC_31365 [Plantactinospora siamensis]|uniref:Recombinase zinc beta ribbon domain-containing protein n=1 Tax=Plantactinospora siamensis TaxID=555372 RepID=A0ABV6P7P1_9ACTN
MAQDGEDGSNEPGPARAWWEHPGRPTPYLLWGLIWCHCGTPMVPADRLGGSGPPERFYRCDAGCGRPPVPAGRLEGEVFGAVVTAALDHAPRWTLRRWRTWSAGRRSDPDRRRDLIRSWVHRVVASDGQPPLLLWADYAVASS